MTDKPTSKRERSRRRRLWTGVAGVAMLAAPFAVIGSPAASSASTAKVAKASNGSTCGQNIGVPPDNVKGVYSTLPKSVQATYGNWPFPLLPSAWAHFKGVKKKWTFGFISFPIYTQWQIDILSQIKTEIAKLKSEGLATGKLLMNVAPTSAAATPAQQISAIQQMVREGVSGIFLLPTSSTPLAPAITAAGKAGVPVALIDNVIGASQYAINVWSQNQAAAQNGVLKLIGGKGDVVNLTGPPGQPSDVAFNDSLLKAVARCPNVHIIATLPGNWTTAGAETAFQQFFASHPDAKLAAVLQNGATMVGILEAYIAAGKTPPPIDDGGCGGGELAWWWAHRSTYKTVGTCFNGFQTGYTVTKALVRVLGGKGLKVNGIPVETPVVTNANLAQWVNVGQALTSQVEPKGPLKSWGGEDSYLNQYFNQPGTPGNL
ncbi:MAG TPA: substrate-binding domain-containing protein [Acidimicrobiales bacterium]|nr:substrate-binding domain-containing protein [Acidimicrobiales bacterium]